MGAESGGVRTKLLAITHTIVYCRLQVQPEERAGQPIAQRWVAALAPLDRIAAIYEIEAKARGMMPDERMRQRQQTASLVAGFFDWATGTVARLSAKSPLADAFRYALTRREALSRFLTDGRLEPDNNIAENAIRSIALGRKNYLFAGSDTGGERAASIYTIEQTAKLNGLNPETYLRDTLTKIAEGHPINRINELMPWHTVG
jgi:transposase